MGCIPLHERSNGVGYPEGAILTASQLCGPVSIYVTMDGQPFVDYRVKSAPIPELAMKAVSCDSAGKVIKQPFPSLGPADSETELSGEGEQWRWFEDPDVEAKVGQCEEGAAIHASCTVSYAYSYPQPPIH